MKVLTIDDEKLALDAMTSAVKNALPDAEIMSFTVPEEALAAAEREKFDIVFSDIQMPGIHGINLAKSLKRTNPEINIIFVTGYSDYKDDAIHVHASGYLNKPVTKQDILDELDNLLHPIETPMAKIYAQTFGNFGFFVNNKPVKFRREKEKEMLAYLIDRRGVPISRKEVASVLFEDGTFSRSEQVYLTTIANYLSGDLKHAGADGVFEKYQGDYRVDVSKFRCDSYDYLDGETSAINKFVGEYMEQYSWSEYMKDKFF